MKRGYLSSLARLALAASASAVGTADAGIYPYLGTVDSPGVVVTTQGVLISAANQLTDLMENRLRQIRPCEPVKKTGTGGLVKNPLTGFAMWGNAQYDHLHSPLASTEYNGHITYLSGGFDTSVGDIGGVLGLGVTWENDNFNTSFNWGHQDEEGWALFPYFAMMLSDCWGLMILGGYEWLDYDMHRTDHISLPIRELTSSVSGGRYFFGGELVFQNYYCNWDLGAQVALLYLHEHNRGFYEYTTDSYTVYNSSLENHLGRFKLGATLGYLLCDTFEPYIRAAFLWDFTHTDILVSSSQVGPANSDTSALFGIGLDFFSTDNVVFNADLYTEQFRDDFSHWGAMINFRVTL